ncbi:MAG: hypothetical protein H6735_27480 [Alphaproteobacteria bacterium]|nr:hypothetical protein [Alphaproteobacteria bacterium]
MNSLLSLAIPIPCIRGRFGDRIDTFQTQVRPDQVPDLLGHDPRPDNWKRLPKNIQDMYEYLQRKTTRARRRATRNYIEDRIGPDGITLGAFPSISIGMVQPATFEPSDSNPNVGILKLDLSANNVRVMLDGLGRYCGAMDLHAEGKPVGDWFSFPVTIYAPSATEKSLTLKQLGQLFHDFNFLQMSVSPAHAMALDQSDLYISLANMIGKSDVVQRNGGMEERARTLGKKSTALVVQNTLVRFAFAVSEGSIYRSGRAPADAALTRENIGEISKRIQAFLELMESEMGARTFSNSDSIHLTSGGWQALGLALHDLEVTLGDVLTAERKLEIGKAVAAIDWSRQNRDFVDLIGNEEEGPNGESRVRVSRAGRTVIEDLADYVREKSGLSKELHTHKAGLTSRVSPPPPSNIST